MVYSVQDADSGDLDHLAAGIVSDLPVVLTVENAASLLKCPAIDHFLETVLDHFVRHIRIIALYVAFQHITCRAVLSVVFLQEAFQSFSRQIRPFALLAGHVVVDKAAADVWVEDIVVQASLENTIPEVNADNVAFLWVENLEFLWFLLFVFSILKVTLQNQILFQIVQEVVCRRVFPYDALDAFHHGFVERFKACDFIKVSRVDRLTITVMQWSHPFRIVLRFHNAWTFGSLCQIENAPDLQPGRMIL